MNRFKNTFTRLATPFRRLQWRLTLSYTLVSTGALLVVELFLFAILFIFVGSDLLTTVITQAIENQLAPEVQQFLTQSPPNLNGLRDWAETLVESQVEISPTGVQEVTKLKMGNVSLDVAGQQLYILSPDLTVWANVPGPAALGEDLDVSSLDMVQTAVESARQGSTNSQQNGEGYHIIAAPVTGEDQMVLGIILLTYQLPLLAQDFILPVLQVVAITLIPFTLATALVGTIFGFLTARGLTRRIQAMSAAADAWSQGDFTAVVGAGAGVRSGDELGELGQRLNLMAEQLQNLLDTRQELATLEERNRLARDLHDSVKQQVFAITMQLGAARSLLDSDPDEAARRLGEAEQLARQSQQELAGLIKELRPSDLDNRGLVEALQTFVKDWSRRTMIAADFRVRGERPLSLAIEQALFRVAQESLANVARHSRAQQVDVQLIWQDDDTVTLTVQDDGQGFVVEDQAHRGMGLSSMSERMAAINGQLSITSKLEKGTQIVAVANLANKEQ